MKKRLQGLLIYAGFPLAGVTLWTAALFLWIFIPELFMGGWLLAIVVPCVTVGMYVLLRRRLALRFAAKVNAVILLALSVCLMVCLLISSGSTRGGAFLVFRLVTFPFFLPSVLMQLSDEQLPVLVCIFATYAAALLACLCLARFCKAADPEDRVRGRVKRLVPYLITAVVVLACGAVSLTQYLNRPEVRYAGHGFDYMNGYSSTDFADYTVYSEPSKLATLDHAPDFTIEKESEMPVMDGAEACYPLYAAVAKTVYRDIATVEACAAQDYAKSTNGKIVSFTNTVQGFNRLLTGEVDLFFGAKPSKDQFETAAKQGVALTVTPIGREGFVFFVEEDNPVENLTSEQVRAIYHGEITNWREVGGKDQPIKAFQRPQNSGSQAMMEYFMGDVSLMEPDTYEVVGGMLDVLHKVAQYANEDGALGYSFRYFVEGLSQEGGVKLLSIDGVAPTLENIENGSYPLTVALCLVTRTDDPNPNVQRMIDFMLSNDGQELVRKTGYAGLAAEN